jgi:hypothetical protein
MRLISRACPRPGDELDGDNMQTAANTTNIARLVDGNGFRVLRFWNDEVFTKADGVLETIRLALVDLPPTSPQGGVGFESPPLDGEG